MRQMKMARLLVVCVLMGSLVGCQSVQNAYNTLSGTTIDARSIYIAAQTFDAVEVSATNYLRLKKCNGVNGPICRDSAVTAKLVPALRSGLTIRAQLKVFLRDHPGQLGSKGLYDALVSVSNTIRDLIPVKN